MQTTNAWHKLHLYRYQVSVILLLLLVSKGISQNLTYDNLSDYDEKWIHYGFEMGLHTSDYRIKYADIFTTPAMDSLHSIVPKKHGGFKVGFVVDMSIAQYLSFRILPTVGFYDYQLQYRFVDGTVIPEYKDATMMELPLLFKYKSVRRGNSNMYIVGGLNVQFEAAGRGDEADTREKLELKNFNLAFDIGMGFDLFYPLFKFSPEMRYSFGFRNLLPDDSNAFDINLEQLTTHNFTFFITFEGGPTYLKRRKRKVNSNTNF